MSQRHSRYITLEDPRPHWTAAEVFPHHRPRNVKLTNNLTAGGDAGARREGRFVLPLPFPETEPRRTPAFDDPQVSPHHETAMQAASRALDRMLAAGLVKPVVVNPLPRSTWDPRQPREKAPHYKPRNARWTCTLGITSTAATISHDEWEALRAKSPRHKAHEAFAIASRALERMQTAAIDPRPRSARYGARSAQTIHIVEHVTGRDPADG